MIWLRLVSVFGAIHRNPQLKSILIIFVIGALSIASFLWINSIRNENHRLTAEILAIKHAQELTEKLYEANARLIQEQNDILMELRNADGYDTPLPAGIRSALERLRKGSGVPGSAQ